MNSIYYDPHGVALRARIRLNRAGRSPGDSEGTDLNRSPDDRRGAKRLGGSKGREV